MADNGPAKSQVMRVTCSQAVAADGSDIARRRDAVSILCVKGLIQLQLKGQGPGLVNVLWVDAQMPLYFG